MWMYNPAYVSVALKADRASGNHSSLGGAMPRGAIADLSVDVGARLLMLWLYPGDVARPDGITMTYSLDAIRMEDPADWPTGRIDVTGDPSLFFHDDVQVLKATLVAYKGAAGDPRHGDHNRLMRWNSGWMWVE